MQHYESKQVAWWAFALAGVLALVGVGTALAFGLDGKAEAWIGIPVLLVALGLANFGLLTVRVTDTEVRWYFGRGLIGRSIPLDQVRGVEVHRSPWYWGWGIRWTPRGWLWRSHGLDAVWIERSSGKSTGVGSPDPKGLASAIQSKLARDETTGKGGSAGSTG